jgi:transcriptional regulator with XRE-family HTH domain
LSKGTLDLKEMGRRIHMLRWGRWSLLELEELTGIPQSNLSRYERGASRPTVDRIAVLARVLGTTPDYLLGFDSPVVVADPRDRSTLE